MVLESIIGVFTGILGSGITAFTNFKMQKLKNEHEQKMVHLEKESMIAEAQMNIQVTETQVQGQLLQMEEGNYGKNIELAHRKEVDNKMIDKLFASAWTSWLGTLLVFMLGIVDFIKGAMRPVLTAYLVVLTSYITYVAIEIITSKQSLMSVDIALDLFLEVVRIVIYLTVSVVSWWFADRRVAKFLYRLNDGNIREK